MSGITRREMLKSTAATLAAPLLARAGFDEDPSPAAPAPEAGWTSFRNGPKLLGLANTELPDRLQERWTLPAPDGVSATAAIAGGRAYLADLSGNLRCVDLASGDVHWTYAALDDVPENSFPPGFKSSPALTKELVYLGDEDGLFHAVDRSTGKRAWTFKTGAEIISSPTIDGDNVLFGSYDNSLYCLDRHSGEARWHVPTQGYVHCTPAVSEGTTFIAGCDEHLRGIEIATGKQILDMPIGTYLIASPATRDGLLYFGTYGASVVAVDWKKQKTVWTYQAGRNFPFHSSAALTEDLVIVGGNDKNVHAINRATGKKAWIFPTRAGVDSSPVVCGRRVYVGSSDQNLYVLDLKTGKKIASHRIGDGVTASPAVGDKSLIIGGDGAGAKFVCLAG